MNTRNTIALVVVFVALCAGYFLLNWLDTRNAEEAVASRRLFDFDADGLASMRFERSDGTIVEAVRKDGAWDITAPQDHIIPNLNVWSRISNAWSTLSNERTLGERDKAAYGLAEPALVATGTAADGVATTISFGGTEPLQVGRYAYMDGVGVFLVKESAFRELDRPLDDLRERHLIEVDEKGVSKLNFSFIRAAEQGGEPLEPGFKPVEASTPMSAHKADGKWQLTQPVATPADQEALEGLTQGLQFATATNYIDVPESYEDYGLDPPRGQVTVWTDAVEGPQTVFFGDADASKGSGAVWAKKLGNPSVFQIGGQLLGLLPQDPDSFRESRLLTRGLDDLTEIDIAYNVGAIRLVNDAEKGWQLVEPLADDTDQTFVSGYLAVLKNAKGDEFPEITAGDAGLVAPTYSITLHFPDEVREIRIGAEKTEGPMRSFYAQQDFGGIVVLSEVMRNAILRRPFEFRDTHLLRFKQSEVQKLALVLDGQQYVIEKQLQQWKVVSPQAAVLESQSDVDALLKALSDARAIDLEPAPADGAGVDLAAYGLQEPVFQAEVTVANEAGETSVVGPLTIGAVTPDQSQQRFVQTKGRPEVFRAKQALLDAVREALRGVRIPAGSAG